MFKTNGANHYKYLAFCLLIFTLFSCKPSPEYCDLICSSANTPEKSVFFSFELGNVSLGKDKQLLVIMEYTKTREQKIVTCKVSESFNVSALDDFCRFSSGLLESPIQPFFNVRFYVVKEGQYLFTLKNEEEVLSSFTHDVFFDHRFCPYCNTVSFDLNDDLQPKEWK